MNTFSRKEKEVIGILSFGTFLEYFDFYLYIHLTTVLNKVFFEQGDAKSNALLVSFAYMMSFIFRPVSAIILGYVGDKYGRTKVIRTMFLLMGFVCLSILLLPSYREIGVMASFGITFLRMIQGISTMGEIVGGEIYLSEYLKGKKAFIGVGTINLIAMVGCQAALLGVYLHLQGYFDWRYLFIVGLGICALGFPLRRNLTESIEFIKSDISRKVVSKDKLPKMYYLAICMVEGTATVVAYASLIGFNNILRQRYGYTELEITTQNMCVVWCNMLGFVVCLSLITFTRLSPYVVAMSRNILGIMFLLISPFLFYSLNAILVAQMMMAIFACLNIGYFNPIIYKNIPIENRFKTGAITFAIANALAVIYAGFAFVFAEPYLDDYIILVLVLPFLVGYAFALRYFANIDKANPNGILRNYNLDI